MTIVITGATGNLGAHTVGALLGRGIDPHEIVAAGRDRARLDRLSARGVRTARLDFDDPSSLPAAFELGDRVLLISAPGGPRRTEQHCNAIRAAEAADVRLLAYTSWAHAATSTMMLAADHRTSERALAATSTPHAVLRCAGYFEARTTMIPFWRSLGEVIGAGAQGKVSSASREDLAEAAAVVLTTAGHEGAVYELASEQPYTLAEFAEELTHQTGEHLPYVDLEVAEFSRRLVDAGIAARLAANLADYDRAAAAGEAVVGTGDLRRLVGRPLTELPEAISRTLST